MNKKLRNIVSKLALLLTSLAFALTLVAGTASARPAHTTSPKISHGRYLGGDTMYRGGYFDLSDGGNDYLLSQNGHYQLKFQPDGNLVEYYIPKQGPGVAIWASWTRYVDTCRGCGQAVNAIMQSNGNFAMYDSQWHRVFASNTVPNGYKLVVTNSSEIVVYDQNYNILWSRP